MRDIWSFLLQTLTASGAAVLLLAVKAMFRDKLSPRWQFAIWGVLAVMLVLPAGYGGRYALVNWPMAVEWARSALTGEYGALAKVTAPIPLPPLHAPASPADWLFLGYELGVVLLLAWYMTGYIRLRLALRRGKRVRSGRVEAAAEACGLPVCPAVEVDGLPTAFICGVLRPVLALPAGAETDDKVLLHELLHLKHRDVVWGWVICLFRCLHWCNPLLWACANRAGNDLEALCDQRVLERLEGEDRRDYGRILLSMADEKYARAPGTSSAANGGKNIRRRIEAIARFKRYPAGMALASVCVGVVLTVPLVAGARAEAPQWGPTADARVMASARTTWCTTCAGAFDAYAKALLTGEISYRAMCAPLREQNTLARDNNRDITWLWRQAGDVKSWPNEQEGYQICNLTAKPDGSYEGVLALTLNYTPDDAVWSDWDGTISTRWMAVQTLRAEREGERWVIVPLDELTAVQGDQRDGGNIGLPAVAFEARYGDFLIHLQAQTTASVRSYSASGSVFSFPVYETVPKPHGEFDAVYQSQFGWAEYLGTPEDAEAYTKIELKAEPVYNGPAERMNESGKTFWGDRDLRGDWWNDEMLVLAGGGGGYEGPGAEVYPFPSAYQAELILNGETAAELTLLPVEGGAWID